MYESLFRMIWIVFAASAIAYAAYLYVGSTILKNESGVRIPIVVRDIVEDGTHNLSGILMVPFVCDELKVKVTEASKNIYELTFTTWSEPSIACPEEPTARVFHATVFAPAQKVRFIATLDDVSVPIAVYQMSQSLPSAEVTQN